MSAVTCVATSYVGLLSHTIIYVCCHTLATQYTQGFAEEWERLTSVARRSLATGFFFFYVIFAIVLLNLFIGIITDVYPNARERSRAEWERTITQLMEDTIKSRRQRMLHPTWWQRAYMTVFGCCRRDSQEAVAAALTPRAPPSTRSCCSCCRSSSTTTYVQPHTHDKGDDDEHHHYHHYHQHHCHHHHLPPSTSVVWMTG